MNTKTRQIMLGDTPVDVVLKDIKNVHLSVYPPSGKVRVSAPAYMDLDTIRVFTISKLGWIRKQQARMQEQEREAPREYISRESHYYLGKRYLFKVNEQNATPKVVLRHSTIELNIRPVTSAEKRGQILDAWYRQRLKEIIPVYIQKWEPLLKVKVEEFGVKQMKTKWGSCSREAGRIWLNLEMCKKPRECIEYVIVHEMVHLLERRHGEVFTAYMDKFLPQWKSFKVELNRSPLRHEEWSY